MTHKKNLMSQPVNSADLIKSMLFGAGAALLVISAFVLSVNHPQPEWGKLWMLRPLIIAPLAGAAGGAFYYSLEYFFGHQGGLKKALAVILGLIGFVIALWLGVVLGFAGTLWH